MHQLCLCKIYLWLIIVMIPGQMFCHLFHVILNINIGVCLITKILSALFFIICPLNATPSSVLVALVFPGTMMTNEAWLKSSILGKEELKEWTKSFRWRNCVKFEVAVRPLGEKQGREAKCPKNWRDWAQPSYMCVGNWIHERWSKYVHVCERWVALCERVSALLHNWEAKYLQSFYSISIRWIPSA